LAAVGGSSSLDVIVIGEVPASLRAQLRELGVEFVTSPPHPLDAVGRNTNKLLGLRHPSDAPVLLVDNDLCFLEDVSDLVGRSVRASFGGSARVTEVQWAHIEQATGLKPLAAEYVPMREELEAAKAGREPKPEQRLYLSAGVVWVAEPLEFEAVWSAHIDAIARAFEGHPASTRRVRGCDQAGFATAVAAAAGAEGFDLLPFAYNYRPMCFRLGLSDRPKILHLNKLGEDENMPLSKAVTKLWDQRMLKRITRDSRNGVGAQRSQDQQEQLLEQAINVRDRVLKIGADADLDSFAF
jgi:hypothetical protein